MPNRLCLLLLASLGVLDATRAWADDAACRAIEEALVKMATTPVHETVIVERAPTTLKSETIRTADKTYVEVRGKWMSKPYDSQAEVASVREKMKQEMTDCSRERAEAVDGEAADLYLVHATSAATVAEMKLWISTAKGLPLKVVSMMGGGKMRSEVRMDYVHVGPPPDVGR